MPTALIPNPNVVLPFSRDNVDIGVLTRIAAYQLQFRVCSSTCTPLASEKVPIKSSDLNNYSSASIVRYFPCSLSEFGAVGLPYKDTIVTQQCVCTCPTTTTRSGSNCVVTSSTRDAMCPWSANTAGFKCSWVKPGANVTVAYLQTAIDLEAAFTAFSNDLNVGNNPASERADFKNRTMLDWFAGSYTVLGADSPSCFHNFVLRDLLNTPKSVVNVLALDTVVMGKLQCKRCCSKQTILCEYTYDYQCSTPAANAVKTLAGNESCSLNHCISIKGDALVDASAATTDGKVLAKIITCAMIDSDCVYKASLGSLVAVTVRWKAELPNQDNYLSAFNDSNYVFWRYKVGASSWLP